MTDLHELTPLDPEALMEVPPTGGREDIDWCNVVSCDLTDNDVPPTSMDNAPSVPSEVTQVIKDAFEETLASPTPDGESDADSDHLSHKTFCIPGEELAKGKVVFLLQSVL